MARNDGTEFDFFAGDWTVRHRRLLTRLGGADDWQEFEGTTSVQPLLDGLGNVDDNLIQVPSGKYRAVSLRTFDPQPGLWSIWWIDGRTPHRLDPPVVGSFADGQGTFLADDTFDGKPIKVQFRWTGMDTDCPKWSQAFSTDGGGTWEANWTMEFTRA